MNGTSACFLSSVLYDELHTIRHWLTLSVVCFVFTKRKQLTKSSHHFHGYSAKLILLSTLHRLRLKQRLAYSCCFEYTNHMSFFCPPPLNRGFRFYTLFNNANLWAFYALLIAEISMPVQFLMSCHRFFETSDILSLRLRSSRPNFQLYNSFFSLSGVCSWFFLQLVEVKPTLIWKKKITTIKQAG